MLQRLPIYDLISFKFCANEHATHWSLLCGHCLEYIEDAMVTVPVSPINCNYDLQTELIFSFHTTGQSLTVKPSQQLDLKCDLKCQPHFQKAR